MLRLPPFRFHRPDRVDDAVSLLAEHGEAALPMAGGTDLVTGRITRCQAASTTWACVAASSIPSSGTGRWSWELR